MHGWVHHDCVFGPWAPFMISLNYHCHHCLVASNLPSYIWLPDNDLLNVLSTWVAAACWLWVGLCGSYARLSAISCTHISTMSKFGQRLILPVKIHMCWVIMWFTTIKYACVCLSLFPRQIGVQEAGETNTDSDAHTDHTQLWGNQWYRYRLWRQNVHSHFHTDGW